MNHEIAKRPWTASERDDVSSTWAVDDAEGYVLAEFIGPHAEAHARLFAAGPELAEAATNYMNAMEQREATPQNGGVLLRSIDAATALRTALAKLTGKE